MVDGGATLRLADPPGSDFDVQLKPKSLDASDAVTIVLPARVRGQFPAWLRAPRVAAVILVLGAGVSIRLLRRPSGDAGVREPATTKHFAGVSSSRRGPDALVLAHHRAKTSLWRGAGRQRGIVHGHPGSTTSPSGGRAHPGRGLSSRPEGDVTQASGAPAVDDTSASAHVGMPSAVSRRRSPCLPGTLGC